jgi:hypothetical protein
MPGEDTALKSAEATLRQDLKSNNVSKFIHDLNADLTNAAFKDDAAKVTELKKVAHDELVAKHLIPNVDLGKVDEKTIAFDAKNAHYFLATSPVDGHAEIGAYGTSNYYKLDGDDLVAKPTKEKYAGDPRNPLESYNTRDANTGRITSNGIGDFTYDDNGNVIKIGDWELKEETTGDPPKMVRHWVDHGQEFTKAPVLDQKTGEVKYQSGDTRYSMKADGSDIGTDKAGNVTEITNIEGTTRHFTWVNGKLIQVDYTAGKYNDRWKLEDGKWVNYKPKVAGSDEYVKDDSREPLKNIQVTADGTYTQTNKDDKTRTFKLDSGEGGTENRDINVHGAIVHWKDGQIGSIDYKDGKKRAFTYDASGKLTQSEYEDPANHYKDKWVLEGDKGKETWVNYKGDASTPTKYTKAEGVDSFKDIGVKSYGDYYEVSPDGKKIQIFSPSGGVTDPIDVPATPKPDEKKEKDPPKNDKTERDDKVNDSTIHWKDGQITSVTDKEGNKRVFKYEGGNLTGVDYIATGETDADPEQSWTKKSNHWENGEDPPAKKKEIGVTKNGDYYEVSDDGKKKHTVKTDGTEADADVSPDTLPPAPAPAKKSMHDQWVEARVQAQKDSEKDVTDNDSHTVKFGDTMWDIARASAKKNSDDQHPPTNREIANEINRLIKNYNEANPDAKITNANKVPIGTEIDTSPDQ